MRPLKSTEIFGNWATSLLNIKDDGSICFSSLEADLRFVTGCEVNGIYTNGTAGEFNEQSESEFCRISELTEEICSDSNTSFQIGASHTSTRIMIQRIKLAAKLKPGAIQVILPDWFPLNDAEAIDFLRQAADAADGIGIVLYNPPHAKRVLSPKEMGYLRLHVPEIVGVKVKGGDDQWFADMAEHCQGISVFVPGHTLATGLTYGASGSYSNIACLHPLGAQLWYEMAISSPTEAIKLEKRIRQFMDSYVVPFRSEKKYCNAALDKLLAGIGGWSRAGTRLRSPYHGIDPDALPLLRKAAQKLIPEIVLPRRIDY